MISMECRWKVTFTDCSGRNNIIRHKLIIEIKNKLSIGDTLELIIPNEVIPKVFKIEKLIDSKTMEEINTVNPGKQGQTVIINIPYEVKKGWILRRKK